MTHEALQFATPNLRESTVPPRPSSDEAQTVEVISSDATEKFVPAIDSSRGLLERQARDVAIVALANVGKLPGMYERYRHSVETAVDQGVLDLSAHYPAVEPADRLSHFVQKSVEDQLTGTPKDALLADVNYDKIADVQTYAGIAPAAELQRENESLKKQRIAQQHTILELRALSLKNGATKEQMEAFDLVAKLATAPQIEAHEHEVINSKSLTEKFKDIIRPLMSRKALAAIGLVSPRSAEVTVIHTEDRLAS